MVFSTTTIIGRPPTDTDLGPPENVESWQKTVKMRKIWRIYGKSSVFRMRFRSFRAFLEVGGRAGPPEKPLRTPLSSRVRR